MKVLVTRPQEDAEETAQLLAQRGHQALIAPLLETHFFDGPALLLEGVQAVLATSANGVRALARRTARRDVPLFAVGPQTASTAMAAGFSTVRNANGDARALAQATAAWARSGDGVLLHACGADSAGSLAENLRLAGFTVQSEILYAVTPLDLTADAVGVLKSGALDGALFYSPRSAGIFRDAVLKQGLPTESLIAVCISAATAAALSPLAFAAIKVAAAPHQDALLACLD